LIFERIEAQANVDVTPEYITNNRTHYGDHFNNDEEIMFALFEKELKKDWIFELY